MTEPADGRSSTTDDLPERFPLTSMDVVDDRQEMLRTIFPEVFEDGKINFATLRRSLGDWIEPEKERFGLTWPGKAECMRVIQQPSIATLLPDREESVDFDTTQNLIIEGDNLEVLKLLQKSYYGKVKMIYIDPPYNTGNEFIYPDNFREGLTDYLRYSGQVDSEGIRFSANTDTQGRYHSKWLSMMYPRLYLARNLLRDDGVIFVSIDDNEVHTLRILMNEIFGEENFIAEFVWKSRHFTDTRAITQVSTDHEYVLAISRLQGSSLRGVQRDELKFSNPDNDPRGPWMSRSILGLATASQRPNRHYDVVEPATGRRFAPNPATGWRYSEAKMQNLDGGHAKVLSGGH